MSDRNNSRIKSHVCRQPRSLMFWIILGAGVGTALMVANNNAAMLAVGIGIGLLIGMVSGRRRDPEA